jgi:Transposase
VPNLELFSSPTITDEKPTSVCCLTVRKEHSSIESTKYIGMDVHKDAISIAVLNSSGKLVMESIVETKANTILEFVHGLRGSLHLTFEEGTWAAWLYDLLKPHVTKLVVCDPRRNDYLKQGSKSDRIDARKLAELLRSNLLRPVYHGEHGVRPLKELARSYLTITKDQARVMTRVKAVYRSWAIPCAGKQVYGQRPSPGVAGQDPGGRRAPPGRVLLCAVGRFALAPPGSAARAIAGEQKVKPHQNTSFSHTKLPRHSPRVISKQKPISSLPISSR